jgi:hypothetical protein
MSTDIHFLCILFNLIQIKEWLFISISKLTSFDLANSISKHFYSIYHDNMWLKCSQNPTKREFVHPNIPFRKLRKLKFLSRLCLQTQTKPQSYSTIPSLRHSHAWWCSYQRLLTVGTRPELLLDEHWCHLILGNALMELRLCALQRPLYFYPMYSNVKQPLPDDASIYRYSAQRKMNRGVGISIILGRHDCVLCVHYLLRHRWV